MLQTIDIKLKQDLAKALSVLYGTDPNELPLLEPTRAGVEGDYTLVVFPYVKRSKKSPEATATEIGEYIKQHVSELDSYNVIKGFLNLTLAHTFWIQFLNRYRTDASYGTLPAQNETVLVEYSSPNTNKPLHLGHVRNNLLGYAVAQLMQAAGKKVVTCNLVNDRGIHICKSMLAWQQFGNGETPESSGIKGDHLVGKYYVLFDKQYKTEMQELIAGGMDEETAAKQAPSILQAQDMLRKWEAGDPQTIQLWKTMNSWVYAGFEETYQKMGVRFDKMYYESNTYLLGKDLVQEGLDSGVFYKKADGSVWVDLTDVGLDHKLLLRSDGTSVYMTQDIGTAELKYADFNCNRSIYVVGNEQDYHFNVLQQICKKLNRPYADGIYHLSYGMVELPHGKMKSREGTVVDADDLMGEMIQTAAETTKALGKTEGLDEQTLQELYETIGMGALKYFILKVDPRKKMLFNPAESIDFHGNTGPFIQYTHARIRSIIRNANPDELQQVPEGVALLPVEKNLIRLLTRFPEEIDHAANTYSPGIIANYSYDIAKAFNQFYHECSILKEPDASTRILRLGMCQLTTHVIRSAFQLLGIRVPERM